MSTLFADAVAAHQAGQLSRAEALYQQVLHGDAHHAGAHYNLGLIYGQQQNPTAALASISRSLQLNPDFGEGWFMLCDFADQLQQYDLMLLAGQNATRLMPNHARAWLRRGLALCRLGREAEAIPIVHRALTLDATLVNGWADYAYAFERTGQFAEAESAILMALRIARQTQNCDADEKEFSALHYQLALIELALGRYREGFAFFRARYRGGTNWKRFESDKPLWRGEDLTGKRLLVLAEQGHGDALMLCRYLPLLYARGCRVHFAVHPALVDLFKNWDVVGGVQSLYDPVVVDCDYHTSIFDLPHIMGTTIDTVPGSIPYLPLPHAESVAGKTVKKVGLVYAGQPANKPGLFRSLPFDALVPLLGTGGIEFCNLTRDTSVADQAIFKVRSVVDYGPDIHSFLDCAKIMRSLDLLITCDTAAAHLAGGMGVPCWTLLPFVPDWRWGQSAATTPWYPSMRLFRQKSKNDWAGVVAEVATALQLWKAGG